MLLLVVVVVGSIDREDDDDRGDGVMVARAGAAAVEHLGRATNCQQGRGRGKGRGSESLRPFLTK